MQAHVICAGTIAHDLLQAPSEGTVYAVFENTFYLKRSNSADSESRTAPSLCCIGPANLQLGPINVRTSLQKIPTLAVGERWYCHQHKLTIGAIELELEKAELWLRPWQQLSRPDYDNVELVGRRFAANSRWFNGASRKQDSRQTIDRMVEQRLSTAASQLQQWLKNGSNTTPFPTGLIGCGAGLTPAGDDILVGALVAMHAWQHRKLDQLIHRISTEVSNTSDISAAHLIAACTGSGIESLHYLVEAIGQTDLEQDAVAAAEALCNYGHSSGYYALQGVLIAARS